MPLFSAGGKNVRVFPGAVPDAPVIYLNTVCDEGEAVVQAVHALDAPPFHLVQISGLDWDHDLSPWDSPPAFRQAQPCTGGADDYLRLLTETILPQAERTLCPRWRAIAGYSLAGLFALYALHRTDAFSCAASVSGSLWFPGFRDYLFHHTPLRRPDCLYFSLGDRESKTRNPLLRTVGQNTAEIAAFYASQGIDTRFESNPGNHFEHAVERTAAGLVWLLRQQASEVG